MSPLNYTLTLFLIISTSVCFGQTATYEDVVTKRVKGKIQTYISKSGEEFSVGDEIELGPAFRNETYDFIKQNGGIEFHPLHTMASNSVVRIKKITSRSKLVYVNTTKANGYVYALAIINLEGALSNGEVISNVMNSDQALEELKKWKSKLDLELITSEEYEAKKKELAKLID